MDSGETSIWTWAAGGVGTIILGLIGLVRSSDSRRLDGLEQGQSAIWNAIEQNRAKSEERHERILNEMVRPADLDRLEESVKSVHDIVIKLLGQGK